MKDVLIAKRQRGDLIGKTYYPEKRRLSRNDVLCVNILKIVLEEHPEISYATIRKSLFQILKEDHYQLLYFDGHLSEFTNRFYETICSIIEGEIKMSDLDMFLCDLMYWSKEAFTTSINTLEKNML